MHRTRLPALPPPDDEDERYVRVYSVFIRETSPPQRYTWFEMSSSTHQKKSWEILQSTMFRIINELTESNIRSSRDELLKVNIIRGMGMFCQFIMQAQKYSTKNTCHYAKLVSLINLDFPEIGKLLLERCIMWFRVSYRRRNKIDYKASVMFIAHLVNLEVAHPYLIKQILNKFISKPDEVALQIIFMTLNICGKKLRYSYKNEMQEILALILYVQLRNESLDNKVKSLLNIILNVYRSESLDNVCSDKYTIRRKQKTHLLTLYSATRNQNQLDGYVFDMDFTANEIMYNYLSEEVFLRERITENGLRNYDVAFEDNEADNEDSKMLSSSKLNFIVNNILNYPKDHTYSARQFSKIKSGQEKEFCDLYLELCCRQRRYGVSYAQTAQILCNLNYLIVESFQDMFSKLYFTAHVYLNNKLRNVAKFYAYLLSTKSISWSVLSIICVTDTTDNSRLFLKILLNELHKLMGFDELCAQLRLSVEKKALLGFFYTESEIKADFIIDFFLSIGLDGLVTAYYTPEPEPDEAKKKMMLKTRPDNL